MAQQTERKAIGLLNDGFDKSDVSRMVAAAHESTVNDLRMRRNCPGRRCKVFCQGQAARVAVASGNGKNAENGNRQRQLGAAASAQELGLRVRTKR